MSSYIPVHFDDTSQTLFQIPYCWQTSQLFAADPDLAGIYLENEHILLVLAFSESFKQATLTIRATRTMGVIMLMQC